MKFKSCEKGCHKIQCFCLQWGTISKINTAASTYHFPNQIFLINVSKFGIHSFSYAEIRETGAQWVSSVFQKWNPWWNSQMLDNLLIWNTEELAVFISYSVSFPLFISFVYLSSATLVRYVNDTRNTSYNDMSLRQICRILLGKASILSWRKTWVSEKCIS